jgi:hypothetical protein
MDPAVARVNPHRTMRPRLAGVLALVVASASLLATSPSPTPPPGIVGTATGQIELTAEAPVATTEMTVVTTGPAPSRTVFSLGFRVLKPERGPFPIVARVMDAEGTILGYETQSPMLGVTDTTVPPCGAGERCEAHYRIVALLTDPEGGPVTIEWTGSAGSHFADGVVPAGASVAVEADEPVLVAGDDMRWASTALETVPVGFDQPFALRSFRVAMPAVDPALPMASGLVVEARVRGERQVVYLPPVAVRVYADGELVADLARNSTGGDLAFGLSCRPACERTYDLELTWSGGDPALGAETDVRVLAWAIPESADEQLEVAAAGSEAITQDLARVRASAPLVREVAARGRIQDIVTARLALPATTGGAFDGFARVTLRGTAPGAAGDEGRIEYRVGEGPTLQAAPGAAMLSVSELVPVTCRAGDSCPVPFDVLVLSPDRPLTFELELEVEFIARDGTDGVPAEASVLFDLEPKFRS